jgi:hypothetical protein
MQTNITEAWKYRKLNNHHSTQLQEDRLVQLPGSRASQSSSNYNEVALQFPQFAQLSTVQWVHNTLEKFTGIYAAISSFLSVQSPTPLSKPQT